MEIQDLKQVHLACETCKYWNKDHKEYKIMVSSCDRRKEEIQIMQNGQVVKTEHFSFLTMYDQYCKYWHNIKEEEICFNINILEEMSQYANIQFTPHLIECFNSYHDEMPILLQYLKEMNKRYGHNHFDLIFDIGAQEIFTQRNYSIMQEEEDSEEIGEEFEKWIHSKPPLNMPIYFY